jgi:hypothetical protein
MTLLHGVNYKVKMHGKFHAESSLNPTYSIQEVIKCTYLKLLRKYIMQCDNLYGVCVLCDTVQTGNPV